MSPPWPGTPAMSTCSASRPCHCCQVSSLLLSRQGSHSASESDDSEDPEYSSELFPMPPRGALVACGVRADAFESTFGRAIAAARRRQPPCCIDCGDHKKDIYGACVRFYNDTTTDLLSLFRKFYCYYHFKLVLIVNCILEFLSICCMTRFSSTRPITTLLLLFVRLVSGISAKYRPSRKDASAYYRI